MTLGDSGRDDDQNSRESLIRALAEPQQGYVRRDQLHQLGLTEGAIKNMVRRKFLLKTEYRGVFAVGLLPQLPMARAWGALLVVGDESALSHHSAGSYWGYYNCWRTEFELSTPRDRRPKGVTVHCCVVLDEEDIYTDPKTGVRVTSAARTTLDLTPILAAENIPRNVNRLRLGHKVTLDQLDQVMKRNPTHRGTRKLRRLLKGSQREPTRSDLEDAFMEIVRRYGLPIPIINQHVNGERVDFYFPAHNLIVEVDGPVTHRDDLNQWSEDRRRDREIWIESGATTIRFTYDDCMDSPEMVANTVRRALAKVTAVTGRQ